MAATDGGYFTLQSVVRHSDLYGAANDQCALADLFAEWSRGLQTLVPFLMSNTPFDDLAEYIADSPIYNVDRITTPLLTFKGSKDFLSATNQPQSDDPTGGYMW